MERRIEDVQYCERLFQSFYDIGSTSQGGVTAGVFGNGGRDA